MQTPCRIGCRISGVRSLVDVADAQGSEASLARLPVMRTDVVLTSSDRCIILDTKYYLEALTGAFEERKVRSSHLYQVFAYLENRAAVRHTKRCSCTRWYGSTSATITC
jgi:5-methylcytosine-specific restriction endonuclease McrBC regulatory subunit McrC